jgi:mannose-6-phosphate isomerase
MKLYPFTFRPRLKHRPWGGRRLGELYGKPLGSEEQVGESWEITDRPGDESVIANGACKGKSLRWLMEEHGRALLGWKPTKKERFPWLCKILDARQDLSLQVHPPARLAAKLGGEPKTEMWYVADADPGASLYVGLKRGVTRAQFEKRSRDGTVAKCFFQHSVKRGDVMFLPSGRVHAIGGGQVIFEIQQNSDTTYRVFDWNRTDKDGKPRELHLEQSFASIDFKDFEPELVGYATRRVGEATVRKLVRHRLFHVDLWTLPAVSKAAFGEGLRVLAVVEGELTVVSEGLKVQVEAGRYCLIPASLSGFELRTRGGCQWLQASLPPRPKSS